MSNKRSRAARALMAETGLNYTRALREVDARLAAGAENDEARKSVSDQGEAPELHVQFTAPQPQD